MIIRKNLKRWKGFQRGRIYFDDEDITGKIKEWLNIGGDITFLRFKVRGKKHYVEWRDKWP